MLQFNFDAQAGETPASVAQKRALVAQILGTAKSPSNVGEGFSAIGDGIVANVLGGRAAEAEKAGQAGADDTFSRLVASITGQGATPALTPTTDATATTPLFSPLPDGAEWLRYGNEGATRNLPLNDDLVSALSFLPELGVEMEVFSGGQPAAGEGPRVGSTRHDHGNAADVFFYRNGERLDWSNPEHQPIFEEIVRRGKAAGITGFGAGDGYMQPGSMHVGFGNPGVWGAGGSGSNAPDWLRNAYNGGVSGPSPAPTQVAQGPDLAMLMEASANPWLSDSQKSVINSMIAQQMQQQDPAYQQQLRAGDLGIQQAELELEALRNPTRKTTTINGRLVYEDTGELVADYSDPSTATVGNVVVDTRTGQTIYQGQPEPTSNMRDYDAYAADERAAGREPLTRLQYEQEVRKAGASNTSVTVGGEQTPGWKKIDETFGETYLDWVSGGWADTQKQLDQLGESLTILEQGGDVTGAVGLLPREMAAFFNPDGTIARENVEEVVQRSLREILGAQFTEKEGERLIARAFNPLLSPAENTKRVKRLLDTIKGMAESKQGMVDYFDQNGTLRGYQGPRVRPSDLDAIADEFGEAPNEGQSQTGPVDVETLVQKYLVP